MQSFVALADADREPDRAFQSIGRRRIAVTLGVVAALLVAIVALATPAEAAAGKRAVMVMPFDKPARTGNELPADHEPNPPIQYFTGGFSWDLYAPGPKHGGEPVIPKFVSSDGPVSLRVLNVSNITRPSPIGHSVEMEVSVGGTPVGRVRFVHLDKVKVCAAGVKPSARCANPTTDTVIGYMPEVTRRHPGGWPPSADWEVTGPAGIHVHIEAAKACWQKLGKQEAQDPRKPILMLAEGFPVQNDSPCDRAETYQVGDFIDKAEVEGKIIRRRDGVSWVVLNGKRQHIASRAHDICAQFVHNRQVARTGLSQAAVGSIPEVPQKYSCSLNRTLLRAMDKPDPKPSYAYYGGYRHKVPDGWTYGYYQTSEGFRPVDVATEAAILQLPDGGVESPKIDARSIPSNSIVRRSDGVSWVVSDKRELHHIPFIQDDVCWRNLNKLPVSATGLADGQVRAIGAEKDKWPCIIGDRIVKSTDGSSHLVDRANVRHWVPDADTFWVLARQVQVVGPWPANDVNSLKPGDHVRPVLDPEAVRNSLVCRVDNVCWAVDGDAVRHHVPTHADNVCFRWVHGWKVSRGGVSAEQASSLREQGAWGCSLNHRILATNEGAAYYMEGNTRRWIQDGESFYCYADRGAAAIRGIGMGEALGIGEGHWMPRCLSPHRVKGKVVRERGGTAYFVDGAGWWHWIPNGDIWGCLTRRHGLLISDATWEQLNSLRGANGQHERGHANCQM